MNTEIETIRITRFKCIEQFDKHLICGVDGIGNGIRGLSSHTYQSFVCYYKGCLFGLHYGAICFCLFYAADKSCF